MKKSFYLCLICFLLLITSSCYKKEEVVVVVDNPIEEIEDEQEEQVEEVEEIEQEPVEEEEMDTDIDDAIYSQYEYDIAQYQDELFPHRYRTVYKELKKPDEKYEMDSSYTPSTKGLENCQMSGSAEFSEEQLETLANDLKAIAKGPIYIVDLRQETHLFKDGQSIYWNETNKGLTSEKVLDVEYDFKYGFEELEPELDIKTEKELVEEYGLNYVRFACEDNQFPSTELVDEFMDFVKTLPKNAWLHFHCKEGKGRTTTFMTLYDLYKNRKVDLKDIAYRQYCIGGVYVLYDGSRLSEDDPERDYWEQREYYTMLFADYIKSSSKQSWAKWLEANQ